MLTCSYVYLQVLVIVGSAMVTAAVMHGFARHVWSIPQQNISTVVMYDYVAQAFGLASACAGRIGFMIYLFFLLVTAGRWRVFLLALGAIQLATNAVSIMIMFLQCPGHESAIWNRPRENYCWDVHVQAYYGYFQGGKRNSMLLGRSAC